MSPRYIAIVRRGHDQRAAFAVERAKALELTQVVAGRGLEVWANLKAQIISSPAGQAHVLGRLFTREDEPQRVTRLDCAADKHADLPGMLTARYWGQYLSFSQCGLGSVQVYRDPSGSIPCYVHEAPEHVLLFSDIDLAIEAGLIKPEIDWSMLATDLLYPALRRRETTLRGIYEIPQGWLLGIGGSSYCGQRQIWSPWDHVAPTELDDSQLPEAVRTRVSGTVRALASAFERVQLCLSGGLDSSIVAAALRGTDTVCLNLVSPGPEGDERRHARLVADHCGFDLYHREYRIDDVDIGSSSASHLPRPVGAAGRLAFDRINLRFATETSADALFTGNAGDNLFCLMPSATPIADRLRSPGERLSAWRTVLDICELTGCSVRTALSRAARKLPKRAAPYDWKPDPRFLDADAISQARLKAPLHNWLDAPEGVLPGRAAHIAAMMRPQNFSEGFDRTAPLEMVTPLMAQPVIELCLSIQSWRWVAGGRDRAVARRAFAGDLPPATSGRHSKGGPGGFYRQIVEQRRNAMMGHLLEGQLCSHGLLDRRAIEAFFARSIDEQGFDYIKMLTLTDVESWVRHRSGLT
jgi:asparagine synthase (glutamine-hydrolysing)